MNEQVTPSLEVARRYLRLLYPPETTGYLNLCTFDGKPIDWFAASNVDDAAFRALVLAHDCNVYHSIGPRSAASYQALGRPEGERGGSDAVIGLPGVWLDVDFLHPAHKKKNLPPTPHAALDLINEFRLKPTMVVASGHGFQAWYLFESMWELPTATERARARSLLNRFQATMLINAQEHGWTLDNTSDLARVFRVAGTVNWKEPAAPVAVTISFCDEARRYQPADFEPYLIAAPSGNQSGAYADDSSPAGGRLEDDDVVRRALAAADGGKFSRLWSGDASDFAGDESAADMSLCDKLAFWTNRDAGQMDRLFRRSALYRAKWDEVHYATGDTYGQHTIGEAVAKTTAGYTGALRLSAPPCNGEAETAQDAFTVGTASAFDNPQQEIDYLRRALATERAKNVGLVNDNDRLREENRTLRKEKATLESVHARQWRVIGNKKLRGVGHTAVKLHAEYVSALEHAKGEDGWVPIVIGSDYGVATGVGKSAKRAGGDVQKLVDWDLIDKRTERFQLPDGPNAGQLRTRMFVRFRDPDTFLDDLEKLDPKQPAWGGKRIPRCRDHPHAVVVRSTAYMCQECGQILEVPREQVFGPDGQDVPSGKAKAAVPDDRPEGTRCPSGSGSLSPVDIRTLEGQLDQSGRSPPEEPTPSSTGNPLHDLALKLFHGSYFLEELPT